MVGSTILLLSDNVPLLLVMDSDSSNPSLSDDESCCRSPMPFNQDARAKLSRTINYH